MNISNDDTDDQVQNNLHENMPSFKPCRTNCKCSALFILSAIFLILGLVLLFGFDPLVNQILSYKMVIIEGREGHRFWKDPPAFIERKMYIWHCANPNEVQNGGVPQLVELGPYVYREQWNRSNIFYGDDLDTLSYIPITTLYFDREKSVGPDNVYVTVINVPLLAMAHEMMFQPVLVQEFAEFFILSTKTTLFVNVTVKQLMEGYTDKLIEAATLLKPGTLKDGKFGILQQRNGSYYQNFTIHTGFNDITQVARVVSFNGATKLNYWSTPQANMLNGTDGSLFPPNINKSNKIYSYNADMCRSYYLSFLRERKDGPVTLYDYYLSADIFNMSREENQGFCGHGPCYRDGVLNISTCYMGVWGFISSPHFLQADPRFLVDVYGMNPDPEKHRFVMSFEPRTSVPFGVNVRLQLNFYMPQIHAFHLLRSVKPILMPIVWFDDEARLTPEIHSELTTLAVVLDAGEYLKFIIPSLSFLGIVITSIYIYTQWRRTRHERNNSRVPLFNEIIST